MPQASSELRAEFKDDMAAYAALGEELRKGAPIFETARYTIMGDFVVRRKEGVVPTEKELRAIAYLVDEWDYGYDLT
jgi:hypothetical protein